MSLKVFVDFDGTITRVDVGNQLFRQFGGAACDGLVKQYRAGEIGARVCFSGEAEMMGRFSIGAMNEFIDTQHIDMSFAGLVDFCSAPGIELRVISDGLDYYIRRILHRHTLSHVEFLSNTLSFRDPEPDGTASAEVVFPHSDAECPRCGCCKRNIMLTQSGEQDIICLVGEGFSDRCPAHYADIVFAKDALQVYCQQENISYYPYRSFDDVTRRLRDLTARFRLRPRRRAQMNRRAAFKRES